MKTNKLIPNPASANLPIREDNLAIKESSSFEDESYDKEAKKNEHNRRESFRNHFSKAAIIIFWVLVVIVIIAIFCWAFNILMPESWHFLNPQQVTKIQDMILSAALVKVVPEFAKKYF